MLNSLCINMSNTQNVIRTFQDAILQKSKSLLRVTKSAAFLSTANDMETTEFERSNMRPGHNNIPSFNNYKFAKLIKKYVSK